MVLYVVSLGKKINNQDEKARMPVAPRAEGKEPGQTEGPEDPGDGAARRESAPTPWAPELHQ